MQIINGRKIRDSILMDLKKEIQALEFKPIFCDVVVGEDPASLQYVNMKMKTAESLGLVFHKAFFNKNISTSELIDHIKLINKIENMSGVIVQLPLPSSVDTRLVLDAIESDLDVDCLGAVSNSKFYNGENVLGLPTALACMHILDSLNIDLSLKNIVVLGTGELVGRPVSKMLELRNLKHICLNSMSKNKEEVIKNADVIISGIGQASYIKGSMLKKDVILIDAGTSESNGSLSGDVDLESVKEVASIVSPVPGGVGPVTIAMLFKNVLEVAKNKHK
ncbi:MAG: bifunctional 5,10-methylenetetrahydrofolate dehydrogenase/5,10-methenyltetrahydrofolate cyclohydrolase [Candidatus Paceibacterota bacterium]